MYIVLKDDAMKGRECDALLSSHFFIETFRFCVHLVLEGLDIGRCDLLSWRFNLCSKYTTETCFPIDPLPWQILVIHSCNIASE